MPKMKLGAAEFDLVDNGAPTVLVDALSETAEFNGIVRLSFVSVHRDAHEQPVATVSQRTRMTIGTAKALHKALEFIIEQQEKAALARENVN